MTIHLNSKQRSDLKEAEQYMASKRKNPRPPFFDAWTTFWGVLCVVITVVTVGNVTGDNPLPMSNLLWLLIPYALVFGGRAVQLWLIGRR